MAKRTAPKIGEIVHRLSDIIPPADDSRVVRFEISDEVEDRVGDIITADGWQFDNFLKNPVVLWAHNPRELPIGRVEQLMRSSTKTFADVLFAGADENPFAESVFRMIKAKFLRACSVGFRALSVEPIMQEGEFWPIGFKFLSQELLELSVVSIPALPTALAVGKALDVPERDLERMVARSNGESAMYERQRVLRNLDLKGFQS